MAYEFKDQMDDLHWSARVKVIMDNLRVVPRVLVGLYGYICYDTHVWFRELPDPTSPQQFYANVIWGAAAAWFTFYMGGSPTTKTVFKASTKED